MDAKKRTPYSPESLILIGLGTVMAAWATVANWAGLDNWARIALLLVWPLLAYVAVDIKRSGVGR